MLPLSKTAIEAIQFWDVGTKQLAEKIKETGFLTTVEEFDERKKEIKKILFKKFSVKDRDLINTKNQHVISTCSCGECGKRKNINQWLNRRFNTLRNCLFPESKLPTRGYTKTNSTTTSSSTSESLLVSAPTTTTTLMEIDERELEEDDDVDDDDEDNDSDSDWEGNDEEGERRGRRGERRSRRGKKRGRGEGWRKRRRGMLPR